MASQDDTAAKNKRISDEASLWVVRLNSGEATAQDRRDAASWRAVDERHEAAFRQAEIAWAAMSGLGGSRGAGPARKRRNSRKKLVVFIGAGLAAALVVGSLNNSAPDYATRTAEIKTVVLSDGSKATLNARAAIDVRYTPDRRHITISKGEVFFEVATDKERPFVVDARNVSVTARGTAFLVRQIPESEETEVVVTENAVDVTLNSKNDGQRSVRVSQNQKVFAGPNTIGRPIPADTDAALSWRKGLLIVEDRPLAEVIGELNQFHTGWIVVASPAARDLRVNAVLTLQHPNAALETLAAGLPIAVHSISPYFAIVISK